MSTIVHETPYVDAMQPDDARRCIEIMEQREDRPEWRPIEGQVGAVVRYGEEICGFILVRVDVDRMRIEADQLEAEREGGKLTRRGAAALTMMHEFLINRAKSIATMHGGPVSVIPWVDPNNEAQRAALEKRGYEPKLMAYEQTFYPEGGCQ